MVLPEVADRVRFEATLHLDLILHHQEAVLRDLQAEAAAGRFPAAGAAAAEADADIKTACFP